MFPPSGIRIYAMSIHSQEAGKSLILQHFRNNRELPWISVDDNYDSSRLKQIRILLVKIGNFDKVVVTFESVHFDEFTIITGAYTSFSRGSFNNAYGYIFLPSNLIFVGTILMPNYCGKLFKVADTIQPPKMEL